MSLTIQDQPATINLVDEGRYRIMIGSDVYLPRWSRSDIVFAVSELSRFVSMANHVLSLVDLPLTSWLCCMVQPFRGDPSNRPLLHFQVLLLRLNSALPLLWFMR